MKMLFQSRKIKILSVVLTLCIILSIGYVPASIQVSAYTSNSLSPVSSRDVIYQIITDRFYDGDTSNNIPVGFDPTLFDGTGSDLKLYQGGDWAGIIEQIPYLKGMGVTAVWISAPYENRDTEILDYQSNGSIDRWTSFHGYHVRNYFATNKHFGTLNEFKELRDALHAEGMKLIIDFVTNHTSRWQNPTLGFAPEDGKLYEPDRLPNGDFAFDINGEPYDYNNDGLIENLIADPNNDVNGWFHGLGDRGSDSSRFGFRHKELGSLADFSHENGDVVAYLEKASLFWLDMGVNGFRHDATLHMNPAFVKGLKDAVDSSRTVTHFGEFFIGRPDPKYDEYVYFPKQTGVNNLDFEYFRAITSTFGNFSTPMSDFANMLVYTQNDYEYQNQAVTFIDNHDVTRFGYIQQNQRPYNAALAVLLSSRGTPTIYYGTEQYINPGDASDVAGRVFMQTFTNFDTTTVAYQVTKILSDLRQENDALAYGLTNILYSDSNVLVFERVFYDDVVVIAVNRQPDISYSISSVGTSLPNGNYNDALDGLLYGGNISVSGGTLGSFTLTGGEVSIWEYSTRATAPQVGDVVSYTGRAGNDVYLYGDGLDGTVSVVFRNIDTGTTVSASVDYNDRGMIKTSVPVGVIPGDNVIEVIKGQNTSNSINYSVLSGDQSQVIFHINKSTSMGENVYVVGSLPELGNWDPNKASEAFMNPNYPEWFLPVSVPAGTSFEFKFIIKNSAGVVIWEGGNNRTFTSAAGSSATIDTPLYYWQ